MSLVTLLIPREKWLALLQVARLDRPIGSLLLLWPTLCALWMAAGALPSLHLIFVFTMGTLLTRSAGCIANDLADRNFDGHVKRTAQRPLATGRLRPIEALGFMVFLLTIALVLVLTTNLSTLLWAIGAVLVAGVYPLLKRVTHLPQVGLGIAFSFGIPMAYAAQDAPMGIEAGLLFLANVSWVIAYDTCYAMVDRDDDLNVGIRSTAILFGDLDRVIVAALQALTVVLLYLMGERLEFTWHYQLALGIIGLLFIYQQGLIWNRQRDRCFSAFLNNQWVGAVLFLSVLTQF